MPISPHTKPGTHVVCVENTGPSALVGDEPFPLEVGRVYVVAWIELQPELTRGVAVVLCGYEQYAFCLRLFEPAVLPSCLTDALTSAPVDPALDDLETV